jgi:hypothetical protein
MFTPHNYFGPSPVGSLGLTENSFFPVEDGEQDIDNMSMQSLEDLLPNLDTVDVTTPGWHSAAAVPDGVASVASNDATAVTVTGTRVPAYSPFTVQSTGVGTGLAKKPPALDLSSLKEKSPPTFPSALGFLGGVKPSPVGLPVAQAGFFTTPGVDADKKIPAQVIMKTSKQAPKVAQVKKKNATSMANKIIKRRPRQSWSAKVSSCLSFANNIK